MKLLNINSLTENESLHLNEFLQRRDLLFQDYIELQIEKSEISFEHPLTGALWGILAGDGCLYSDKKTISFSGSTEEREFHEIISMLMKKIFNIWSETTRIRHQANEIETIFRSSKIHNVVSKQLNFPVGLKVGKLHLPTNFNDEWITQAIGRLIIDCDGCVRSYTRNKNIADQLSIEFGQSIHSLKFIKEIENELKRRGYDVYTRKTGHIFSIDGTDQVIKFIKEFGIWNPVSVVKFLIWEVTGYMPVNTRNEKIYDYQKGLLFLSNSIQLKHLIPSSHPKIDNKISNLFLDDFLLTKKEDLYPKKKFLPKGQIGENAWKMFELIKNNPGITIGEIKKELNLDRALLNRFAKKMEEAELIKRKRTVNKESLWKRGGPVRFIKMFPSCSFNDFKSFLKSYVKY